MTSDMTSSPLTSLCLARRALLSVLTHEATKAYGEYELLEELQIGELVRFLRLESVQQEEEEVATGKEDAEETAEAKEDPVSALEDAISMADALRQTLATSLHTQQQKAEEQATKLEEAQALRTEVTPLRGHSLALGVRFVGVGEAY